MNFDQVAGKESVEKAKAALEKNGFGVILAENGETAKNKALELLPKGAEVMNMTSITLETIGVAKEITESGNYASVRAKLADEKVSARDKKRLGAAPEYAVGSVHAITEDGKVFVASMTGSQLGAYSYGADKVIWVVGGQKIVANEDVAKKRIWDYVLPKESVRARKAYNQPDTFNSFPAKILNINREISPGRITIILVNEALGF